MFWLFLDLQLLSFLHFMFMAVEDCHAYLHVISAYMKHYVSLSSFTMQQQTCFIYIFSIDKPWFSTYPPLINHILFFSFIELRQLSFYICVNLCCSYFQAVPWNFDQFLQTSQEVEWQTTAVFLCPLRFCVLVYFLGKYFLGVHYRLQINWIIV